MDVQHMYMSLAEILTVPLVYDLYSIFIQHEDSSDARLDASVARNVTRAVILTRIHQPLHYTYVVLKPYSH